MPSGCNLCNRLNSLALVSFPWFASGRNNHGPYTDRANLDPATGRRIHGPPTGRRINGPPTSRRIGGPRAVG